MRIDLLALTPDDLASLSNRGTVKRAQRELQENTVTPDLQEAEDSTVNVDWGEGIQCTLPPNTPLAECRCTCPAVGVCRHLVQTVLYYQTWEAEHSEERAIQPQAWNPGDIPDEALAKHYRKAELTRLRKLFDEPQVIELVRGVKPLARFHTLPIVVRFLTPGDFHYTVCNCAQPAPCSHIPLAIWAFRLLPEDAESGIVETGHAALTIPGDVLDEIQTVLGDLLELGISGASTASLKRLRGLVHRCQEVGLIWPAEILNEIIEESERYIHQDARFSAAHVAELIGELVLRCRAIRNPSGAVPQLFVRGNAQDNATSVGTARLTGLGCGVVTRRGVTRLSAYLVDSNSSAIVAIQRDTADPKAGSAKTPQPYHELAGGAVMKDNTLANIGARQIFVKGGKRTAEGVFVPGHAAASVMPSAFQWETLRPPLLADSFAESRARRAAQPPSALRPRRVGEDLTVFPIQSAVGVGFDMYQQALAVSVLDYSGETATLSHPYTSRGAEGFGVLSWWLQHHADGLRFVSGQARRSGDNLLISPIALIFERDGQRHMVQPWVDRLGDLKATTGWQSAEQAGDADPLIGYPEQVATMLGELCLIGLHRVDARIGQQWELLAQHGYALGFVRLVEPIATLADRLVQRPHQLDWDWRGVIPLILQVAALIRFAQEEHQS